MIHPKAVRVTKTVYAKGLPNEVTYWNVYHWRKFKRSFKTEADAQEFATQFRRSLEHARFEREQEKKERQRRHDYWVAECQRQSEERLARLNTPPEPERPTGPLVPTEWYAKELREQEERRQKWLLEKGRCKHGRLLVSSIYPCPDCKAEIAANADNTKGQTT